MSLGTLGKRDEKHTNAFIKKLAAATIGRFNLASDGWTAYPMAVWQNLEDRVDYGMLVKIFGEGGQRRSPPLFARPDNKLPRKLAYSACRRASESALRMSERLNGSTRNFCKRMARLTYAFSKKWNNHRNALALHFAHYNYCRRSQNTAWQNTGDGSRTDIRGLVRSEYDRSDRRILGG